MKPDTICFVKRPLLLSALILISPLLRVIAATEEPPSTRFPSQTVVATTEGDLRILHRDDFSTDTLHRIWGMGPNKVAIENGILKMRSEGGPTGKLKVSVEPFSDAELRFRFRFKGSTSIGFGFDDLSQTDAIHGGHLIGLSIKQDSIQVKDTKTGIYDMKHYQQLKDKQWTPELKELVDNCQTTLPYSLEQNRWYEVCVQITGDTLELSIDGKSAVTFSSPGIAHKRKEMYRFNIGKGELHLDDVSLIAQSN